MSKSAQVDFWRVGVVPGHAPDLATPDALADLRGQIAWMPDPGGWKYLADPFGLQRDGVTHVFVEAYDYRDKHGVIEHQALSADGAWTAPQVVLSRGAHLSYPFIVEDGGAVFMVPENHKAGEVALYRAKDFPTGWTRETALLSDIPVAEPSLLKADGRWWLFFTVVGPGARDQKELHIAFADRLTGPWTQHPLNPVLTDRSGARPGGTPFLGEDGKIVLPVQDCSTTYGGAIAFLRFAVLNPREAIIQRLPMVLTGDVASDTHKDGLHTFSSAGAVTLIDVKRRTQAKGRGWIDFQRRLRRLGRKLSGG